MTAAAIHELVQAAYEQNGGEGDCGAIRLRGRKMEYDDQELNRLAHEALGLCWHEGQSSGMFHDPDRCVKCDKKFWRKPNPNYAESLDAVRPLEELAVEEKGYKAYGGELNRLSDDDDSLVESESDGPLEWVTIYALASARTRLLAALKVLGKI